MLAPALDDPAGRRARRTRTAIRSAFNRLILERGYASLTPRGIAEAADIGRSTFYEHYKGVDDLLARSLGGLLAPLAGGSFEHRPPEDTRRVVEHIWDDRRLAEVLFKDETQAIVLRSFASAFEASMRRNLPPSICAPLLAPNLIALQLAASQLSVLSAWVSGRSGQSVQEIAIALHANGRASILALMRPLILALANRHAESRRHPNSATPRPISTVTQGCGGARKRPSRALRKRIRER